MRKLIATIPILYGGRQYQPGDELPGGDAEMVGLWVEYRSARWETDEVTETAETTEAAEAAETTDAAEATEAAEQPEPRSIGRRANQKRG